MLALWDASSIKCKVQGFTGEMILHEVEQCNLQREHRQPVDHLQTLAPWRLEPSSQHLTMQISIASSKKLAQWHEQAHKPVCIMVSAEGDVALHTALVIRDIVIRQSVAQPQNNTGASCGVWAATPGVLNAQLCQQPGSDHHHWDRVDQDIIFKA